MKHLDNFKGDAEACYEDLVQELFDLDEDGIDEIIGCIAMHSSLGRLEYMDMVVQNTIREYDDLREWRDAVGEVT